jgi:hypothetical protein
LNTEGPRKDPELYYTEDVERTYYIQNQKMKENAYTFWNFTRRTLQQKGRKQSSPQTTLQKIGHGSTGDEPLGPPWYEYGSMGTVWSDSMSMDPVGPPVKHIKKTISIFISFVHTKTKKSRSRNIVAL